MIAIEETTDLNTELFKKMFLIRTVEKSLLELFSKGLLNGTVHTCIGQEACSVGVISAIDIEKDIIFSNHRGHGHYLSYSGDIRGLIAEIMGKKEGVCGGVGGSQHMQIKNLYTNGIQGAGIPIVSGMAYAEKLKKSGAIVIGFMGDGTFGEGTVYESFNLMSLWNLPVLIVVEDNLYAQTTPKHLQHSGDLKTRGDSFNIKTTVADGMDVLKVRESANKIIREIRENQKPQILYLETYRYSPHSKGDDFRDINEIDTYKKRDPLINILNDSVAIERESIEKGIHHSVQQIIEQLLD